MQLQDKVIVVIGGTTGLGLSGALACVRAGARVVVVGRNEASAEAAEAQLGDSGLAMVGDARDSETAGLAIKKACEQFGVVDGLYHVAGGSGRRRGDGAIHEFTDEGWEFTVNLNLNSVAWSNRAITKYLLDSGRPGSVLNMSSVLAWWPSPKYFSTHGYAATKAAVEGLTRAGAAHYAQDRIRFNALAPAVVETPMAKRACGDEEIRAFLASKQPLQSGGVGQPDDIDAAVVFLLSDASKSITGQVLAVDGGWSVTEGQHPPGKE